MKKNTLEELKNVSRIEVIDHTLSVEDGGGRAYVKWEDNIKVEISLQDNERTLKIFINEHTR